MSNIWIVRFVPYQGGPPSDSLYRSEPAALVAFASGSKGGRVTLSDDFGVCVSFDAGQGVIVLTNAVSSAKVNRELGEANQTAGLAQASTTGWGKA